MQQRQIGEEPPELTVQPTHVAAGQAGHAARLTRWVGARMRRAYCPNSASSVTIPTVLSCDAALFGVDQDDKENNRTMSIDTSTSAHVSDRYMSAKELADYLGVTVATVRGWKGKGPRRIRVGQLIKFRESEVLAWLETLVENTGA